MNHYYAAGHAMDPCCNAVKPGYTQFPARCALQPLHPGPHRSTPFAVGWGAEMKATVEEWDDE